MKKLTILLLVIVSIANVQFTSSQIPKIEYIAHASFVLESASGTRVLIDPYHSYSQLGYTFPSYIKADFILVTHPHFDHDGTKGLGENTPVYRNAGTYTFNDIKFHGIASKHDGWEEMDKRGSQSYNIIWVVQIGDIKIAHLGDNGLLTDEEIELLKDIDYVIGHPDDDKFAQFSENITYIPNHYLLPQISKHTNWMEPIDTWLEDKEGVEKLECSDLALSKNVSEVKILVFKPSDLVKEWPQYYYDALTTINGAFEEYSKSKDMEDMVLLAMDKVIELSPSTMEGYYYKALFLSKMEKNSEAINVLEKALAVVPDIDWAMEVRARSTLANCYVQTKQTTEAYHQFLWISKLDKIVDEKTLNAATKFLTDTIKE